MNVMPDSDILTLLMGEIKSAGIDRLGIVAEKTPNPNKQDQ